MDSSLSMSGGSRSVLIQGVTRSSPPGSLHQVPGQLGLPQMLGRMAGDHDENLAPRQWASARVLAYRI